MEDLNYEDLLILINEELPVIEMDLTKYNSKGFYAKHKITGIDVILIEEALDTKEKLIILQEEYSHFKNNTGVILNQSEEEIENRKQEQKALDYAIMKYFPPEKIREAMEKVSIEKNDFEIEEELEVPYGFLKKIVDCHCRKGNMHLIDTEGTY